MLRSRSVSKALPTSLSEGDSWEMWDSKLARRAKDHALIQLAAYARPAGAPGVTLAPTVQIILGDGTSTVFMRSQSLRPALSLRCRRHGAD
jgi:predicted RecB family nuclease